jgi:hypothetical protein
LIPVEIAPITSCYVRHLSIWWQLDPHDMARPQVADGGDALQFWREAVNILNKQSRTPDMGGPPAWGLGVGLTTPHRKK